MQHKGFFEEIFLIISRPLRFIVRPAEWFSTPSFETTVTVIRKKKKKMEADAKGSSAVHLQELLWCQCAGLCEASGPKQRSWRLDDSTVVAVAHYTENPPKIKMETNHANSWLSWPRFEADNWRRWQRGISDEWKTVALTNCVLKVFRVNNKRSQFFLTSGHLSISISH